MTKIKYSELTTSDINQKFSMRELKGDEIWIYSKFDEKTFTKLNSQIEKLKKDNIKLKEINNKHTLNIECLELELFEKNKEPGWTRNLRCGHKGRYVSRRIWRCKVCNKLLVDWRDPKGSDRNARPYSE